MTHLESELKSLKKDTTEMWELVISQLEKAYHSLKTFDKDFSREVVANEKRVNSMELKIDRDCENIIALYSPVAIDLRFVLATLKINNNLERIGDIAESIAKYIISEKEPFDAELLKSTEFLEMYQGAHNIVRDVLLSFEREDTKLARSIFKKDEVLDDINGDVNDNIVAFISKYPTKMEQALNVHSIIRKLERVGDQSKNIAEEIIFYMEAKVLKHRK
ncbi:MULTISPECIES: phosphate signaling complex protein PhoU [Arcticibacter]|uniref:Phosphate-specific transport system accessory protein PhoU n=1 Tax=Arcticibacter svalbardensis MN12-7 TaxID=1150600 RepID=R9GPS3_9SPHI|nr:MULTISPECIES: phosphate signaling complex protein PhoU [Arcticibacter]EOR93706.1 Phosphate transport system regulatory protein PhoU [Arcticibacter svalbardensis MN12-7]